MQRNTRIPSRVDAQIIAGVLPVELGYCVGNANCHLGPLVGFLQQVVEMLRTLLRCRVTEKQLQVVDVVRRLVLERQRVGARVERCGKRGKIEIRVDARSHHGELPGFGIFGNCGLVGALRSIDGKPQSICRERHSHQAQHNGQETDFPIHNHKSKITNNLCSKNSDNSIEKQSYSNPFCCISCKAPSSLS
jgi:hypothetical protein